MVYGEDKAHEMARSLLPSTWRGARRAKAHIHRASRRRSKLEVARALREEGEDGAPDLPGIEGDEARELYWVVEGRRAADKVNPFIRWATAVTRELPQQVRLSHVRGCMPRGVIGEHALGHLRRAPAFEDPREREWRRAWWGRRERSYLDRGEYAELLREVLCTGGHRLFNTWLRARDAARTAWGWKKALPPDPHHPGLLLEKVARLRGSLDAPRLLLGLHDVLPFLDSVGKLSKAYQGRREFLPATQAFTAMHQFVRAFKQHRGNLDATARTLEASLVEAAAYGRDPR